MLRVIQTEDPPSEQANDKIKRTSRKKPIQCVCTKMNIIFPIIYRNNALPHVLTFFYYYLFFWLDDHVMARFNLIIISLLVGFVYFSFFSFSPFLYYFFARPTTPNATPSKTQLIPIFPSPIKPSYSPCLSTYAANSKAKRLNPSPFSFTRHNHHTYHASYFLPTQPG